MEQKAKEKGQRSIQFPRSALLAVARRRREPTEAAEQEDAEETAAEVSPQAPSGEHSAGLGGFASPRSPRGARSVGTCPHMWSLSLRSWKVFEVMHF